MQSNHSERVKSRRRFFWFIASPIFLIIVFMVYYLFINVQSANRWVNDFNARYEAELIEKNLPRQAYSGDSTYLSLQRQIAFTKSRLALTKADPIGLSINLTDNIATLEVNGVTVHSTDILDFNISRSLDAIDPLWLATELSKPLQIVSSRATIAKEPIIVKTAPKDTLEAANLATVPDTATNIPVFFELTFNNGFRMVVLQEKSEINKYDRERLKFLALPAFQRFRSNLKNMLKFKTPDYSPEIRLTVTGPEARTIYRAIPEEGLVSLRLR